MNGFALAQWQRARQSLATAAQLLDSDPDSAASRAYYAAFHAVTAVFALQGRGFSKHSAVRTALHRDLIRTGAWPRELGQAYNILMDLRETADYGGLRRVSSEEAGEAVEKARRIIRFVGQSCAEFTIGDM